MKKIVISAPRHDKLAVTFLTHVSARHFPSSPGNSTHVASADTDMLGSALVIVSVSPFVLLLVT